MGEKWVEKGYGNLSICLAPKDLNQSLSKGGHGQLPTSTETTSKLIGAKVLIKLDAKDVGSWHVKN